MDIQAVTSRLTQKWNLSGIANKTESQAGWVMDVMYQGQEVLLKIPKSHTEEQHQAKILSMMESPHMVPLLTYDAEGLLLKKLLPGYSLLTLIDHEPEERLLEITDEIISAIATMSSKAVSVQLVADLAVGFTQYLASSDSTIPKSLVEEAQSEFVTLSSTQKETYLLHGDLHHENILKDKELGWVAIDPKGVIAEREYEWACYLRNPISHQAMVKDPLLLKKRLAWIESHSDLDSERIKRWAFASSVLAAIWMREEGSKPTPFLSFATLF